MTSELEGHQTSAPSAATFSNVVRGHAQTLTAELHQALRETMFDNRFEVRPALFGRVAAAEVATLLAFLDQEAQGNAEQHGRDLCRSGFGEEGVLRMGQALRRFCITVLPEELRIPALAEVERYHSGIVRGFTAERKAVILEEQERIRSAIQRTNHRFAIQMEVAADIARAATSILDLSELLQTAVDLIRGRFDLYYVGIFLADDLHRWATLQANAGEPGQVLLRRGHRLKIGGDSLVGWSVAHGEARIALDVAGTALSFDRPLLDDIHSEMVVPLISRNKVVGAMAVQSRRVGAFTDHDVPVYRIIADQLANAIENARLYERVRQELLERERAAEELRRAKEAAEGASRAKSAFLAAMSHELRTPLTAILGYAELIQRAVGQKQYDNVSADLTQVLVAGKHLLSLINEVLDFSKIEAEKMHAASENFAVSSLVDAVASTVRPLIEQNSNQFEVDCPPEVGLMLSDPTRIRQVLVNLLGNAAKFTNHGKVRLSVRREHSADTNWFIFEVADTGIGIAADKIQGLFQPFSQLDDRPERLYGGTGLGLALSQRLCQLLGGTIEVESELGRGSTFTVRLPDLPASARSNGLERGREAGEPGPHNSSFVGTTASQVGDALILIIDDDAAVCDLVDRYLRPAGFTTVVAATADEGLRLAQDLLPELVLLDIRLPDRDGWQVLAELKSDPLLADIPVIMMTIMEDRQLSYQLGATDYLVKPVDSAQLLASVRRATGHNLPAQRNRILLAEDDLPTAAILCRELEAAGWRVEHVVDGEAVLRTLSTQPPDLLLLDLLLPRTDGLAVIAALEEQRELRVPTIVLTSLSLSEEERARLAGSVELILQKGRNTLDDLLAQLSRVLGAQN